MRAILGNFHAACCMFTLIRLHIFSNKSPPIDNGEITFHACHVYGMIWHASPLQAL